MKIYFAMNQSSAGHTLILLLCISSQKSANFLSLDVQSPSALITCTISAGAWCTLCLIYLIATANSWARSKCDNSASGVACVRNRSCRSEPRTKRCPPLGEWCSMARTTASASSPSADTRRWVFILSYILRKKESRSFWVKKRKSRVVSRVSFIGFITEAVQLESRGPGFFIIY